MGPATPGTKSDFAGNLHETGNRYSQVRIQADFLCVPEKLSRVAHLLVFCIDIEAETEGRSTGEIW
jgi:hypothetical protein